MQYFLIYTKNTKPCLWFFIKIQIPRIEQSHDVGAGYWRRKIGDKVELLKTV